jgi:hypothetical protein
MPVASGILETEAKLMSHYYALLSIVFMITFVLLFDRVHSIAWKTRFCKSGLLSRDEIDQLQNILAACREEGFAAFTGNCA